MSDERTIKPNAPADFTPQLGDYKTLQPFRYWCQKVLPLVYDDSLSYYELLCKVVDYLNKAMEDVETLNSDVTNLHTAYDELQSYVNSYFSTLDVQEEINNKLDSMAKDGTLTNLITAYIDPLINEQNKKITVLENRMDTFASLPEGSTIGNAELLDIRVPANDFNNNNTYPTAGDAVRGQVGVLKRDLNNFTEMVTGAYTIDSSVPTVRAVILITREWYVPTGGDKSRSSIVEIPVGAKEIYIHSNDVKVTSCGILKTYPQSFSGNADFSTEYPSLINIDTGCERTFKVPSDGKYLYYKRTNETGENLTPQKITITSTVLTTKGFIPRGNIVPNYIGLYDGKYYYATSAGEGISAGSSPSYGTLRIPVEPSTHYTCNKLRFLTQTGADDKTLAASEHNISEFTTASNAKYIYATYYTDDNTVDNLVISSGNSLDTDIGKYEIPWLYDTDKTSINNLKTRTLAVEKPFLRYTGDDQSYMFANANSIKRDKVVSFTCDFSTFGSLEVGLADISGNNEVALMIDRTTVKVKKSGTERTGTNHGMTLSEKISVVLIQRVNNKINYEISSNGEKYSGEITQNNYITKPYFTVSDMTVSNVDFSTTCRDIHNNIWLFGDSYFSYGTNRWMYYLIENGYSDNCLIDGYPGESSTYSIPSLKSYIGLAKPKIIVWCVGMNDGSDDDSAPSSTWLNAINEVLYICNQFEITPILATIPTVPSINHEKKNEWIRNSGYQYIDFAKAVGAQSDGTWFTGMLSSDNVHPTISGAMALYYQAITDCPQLLLK